MGSAIAEIMARAGFDWLTVDMEHSVITIREAEELIRVVSLCGVPALVRLTSNDDNQIKRLVGKPTRTLFGFRLYAQVGDDLLTVRVAGANRQ